MNCDNGRGRSLLRFNWQFAGFVALLMSFAAAPGSSAESGSGEPKPAPGPASVPADAPTTPAQGDVPPAATAQLAVCNPPDFRIAIDVGHTETNYGAVKEQQFEVAVLPLGATEPHNLHLPYGTDSYEGEILGEKLPPLKEVPI